MVKKRELNNNKKYKHILTY